MKLNKYNKSIINYSARKMNLSEDEIVNCLIKYAIDFLIKERE